MLEVNPSHPIMDKSDSVKLTIECAPEDVEAIMALVIPFLKPILDSEIPAALPDALMKLARWLEFRSNPIWNQAANAAVAEIAYRLTEFDNELSFNYAQWSDRFLNDLFAFKQRSESGYEDVFSAIELAVDQIRTRQCLPSQRDVYFFDGVPLEFKSWVSRILNDIVTDDEIADAHFRLIDPGRLKELLRSAVDIENDAGKGGDDDAWY